MSAPPPNADDVAAGDKPAVARALNLIEDRRPSAEASIEALLTELATRTPQDAGQRIGLTGPPGVGKSTLTAALARAMRERQQSVGVVAVDPTSVRSGGALLGDRSRMAFDPGDAGLFVRSLSTGGEAGGLAYAVPAAVEVLAAAFDRVIVETTGVGQTETDVELVVDTVALVIQPGSGDVLQFIKAGIMEIPDVIVVNKGDHGRLAQRAASDLSGALDALRSLGMGAAAAQWEVPVLVTSARERTGIEPLLDAFEAHRRALGPEAVRARRRRGAAAWALDLLRRRFGEHGVATLGGRGALLSEITESLQAGRQALAIATTLGERYLAEIAAS